MRQSLMFSQVGWCFLSRGKGSLLRRMEYHRSVMLSSTTRKIWLDFSKRSNIKFKSRRDVLSNIAHTREMFDLGHKVEGFKY